MRSDRTSSIIKFSGKISHSISSDIYIVVFTALLSPFFV